MSFSKSELITQALLRVEGGKPTTESSVRWGECETYLAMCVNYVMVGQYWAENRSEGGRNVNPLLYTVFENIAIQHDDTADRYYFNLPQPLITLPKGRALEVNTMGGDIVFPLVQGDNALEKYYGCLKKGMSYFIEGQIKVWLYNKPALVKELRTKQWVQIHDLDDDAPIILPSDGDTKVVDMMVQFLTGERQMPKDDIIDSKEN